MAAVAASAVTINETYFTRGVSSRKQKVINATIVLSTQGGLTNNIPASVFKLTKIIDATCMIASDNSIAYDVAPSYDGSLLLVIAPSTGAPGDVTGTFNVIVTGKY